MGGVFGTALLERGKVDVCVCDGDIAIDFGSSIVLDTEAILAKIG